MPRPRRAPRDAARIVFARALERVPRLYVAWAAHRAWTGNEYRPDTDLVVEGFPGSANSYLRAWIHFANAARHVTSHQHSPAVVRRAMADGRPLVVVARDPLDAVASALLRFPEMAGWPEGPRRLLARYARTYRPVLRHPDRAVVATFDQAVGEPAVVLARVNARFGTDFAALAPGHEADVEAYLRSLDQPATPGGFGASAPDADRRRAAADLTPRLAAAPGWRSRRARRRASATFEALRRLAGDAG
jgi:hypothetical protein